MSEVADAAVFEGNVHIKGNLTVDGDIFVEGDVTAGGDIIANTLRTLAGLLRLGGDDAPGTMDQKIYLQRNCGSNVGGVAVQSAVVIEPADPENGALLLLIAGANVRPGTICGQINIYGPYYPGNPRRQRATLTVFRQSDGNPFMTLDSTMSGQGDPQGKYEMPCLLNVGDKTAARIDKATGFKITFPAPP